MAKIIIISTILVAGCTNSSDNPITPSPIGSYIPTSLPEKKPTETPTFTPAITQAPTMSPTVVTPIATTPTATPVVNTATPVPTSTPTLSPVPTATPTPVPTSTPTPTNTPTPTPTPIPAISSLESTEELYNKYNITFDITKTYKIAYPKYFNICDTVFDNASGKIVFSYKSSQMSNICFEVTYSKATDDTFDTYLTPGLYKVVETPELKEIKKTISLLIPGNIINSQNTAEPLKYIMELQLKYEIVDNSIYEALSDFDILLIPTTP